jgi:hypothetical protein
MPPNLFFAKARKWTFEQMPLALKMSLDRSYINNIMEMHGWLGSKGYARVCTRAQILDKITERSCSENEEINVEKWELKK